ncbi:hypothetical protein A2814_01625 [Candidatus Nomurabacteria bacterium RIFCSPHIGHO2_01_FULL_38_19]|uniref:Uncharacterized protein n=1 Tax=Candidatus Nomurabacteria bacterium RIFCSPHIGHO2_01_FULL_38_19 TaxID=1801732 RepID=A0A1F6UUW8_9BACT|nr:MAG: hypothetical protein A2814_01625 [Candidatus Nomurabacteria bacterium RIFCSPHIGHO2_01_FULL_38_19]
MLELFQQLFEKYNLPKEKLEQYVAGFSLVLFAEILKNANPKLSDEDKVLIKQYDHQKQYEKILELIQKKYAPAEWSELLEKTITPLLESYTSEVVEVQ